LNLQRKTEQKAFDKACLMAIEHQKYSYVFVLNIIKNKMSQEPENKPSQPLPVHQNIRGKEYYTQTTISF
jgi:hypothetical protein